MQRVMFYLQFYTAVWYCGPIIALTVPPLHPPSELLPHYTFNGTVPLEHYYVDDTLEGNGTHLKYYFDEIQDMIEDVRTLKKAVLSTSIPSPPKQVHHGFWLIQLRDIWLIHALQQNSIKGRSVVVFGSCSPYYESIALEHGAESVTVIEYNKLTYDHPKIRTLQVSQLDSLETKFDVALSISSFDHDGLGRYGDPLNPDGDLEAMRTVYRLTKPEGILFLTVPIGPDVVVWNLHRRYGSLRLPLLLKDWKKISVYGWDDNLFNEPAPFTIQYEPVFVLRKQLKF